MKQQQVNIDISKLDKIVCADCGSDVFCQGTKLYHLSALQSPNGQEGHVNVTAGPICAGCGAVNKLNRVVQLKKKETSFSLVAGGNGSVSDNN